MIEQTFNLAAIFNLKKKKNAETVSQIEGVRSESNVTRWGGILIACNIHGAVQGLACREPIQYFSAYCLHWGVPATAGLSPVWKTHSGDVPLNEAWLDLLSCTWLSMLSCSGAQWTHTHNCMLMPTKHAHWSSHNRWMESVGQWERQPAVHRVWWDT